MEGGEERGEGVDVAVATIRLVFSVSFLAVDITFLVIRARMSYGTSKLLLCLKRVQMDRHRNIIVVWLRKESSLDGGTGSTGSRTTCVECIDGPLVDLLI